MDFRAKMDFKGLGAAVLAYVLWGFFAVYFHALESVPPFELVSWRIVCALPFCIVVVFATGLGPSLRRAVSNPAVLGKLVLSALAVGANWLTYLITIAHHQVLAASLGYYITPLLNVLIGVFILKERLSGLQWAAVGLAGGDCGALGGRPVHSGRGTGDGLVVLCLQRDPQVRAGAFGDRADGGNRGSVRARRWRSCSMPRAAGGRRLARPGLVPWLLAGSGPVTAVPLLLFTVAARKLDLSTLGFAQFITPTILFVLGAMLYGEPLDPARVTCFVLIWAAIGLFSLDLRCARR
jgi:chloramphenicol-sensitive protein RarD